MRLRHIIVIVAVAACASDGVTPVPPREPPVVRILGFAPNTTNVLAASVSVATENADSVQLVFHVAAAPGDSVTPAVTAADSLQLAVYGLLPAQTYVLHARAFGAGGTARSDSVLLTTGALPADLPAFSAGGIAPSRGFVVFGAGKYGLVIDNTGRVVWYHRFPPDGPGLNFVAQPNGRYAARPPAAPNATSLWQEVDPAGVVTRSFGCGGGLAPRFHDLIRASDDSYWIICDDVRTMDLSALGGSSAARVTAAELQHVGADGTVRFRWNAFDHFDIADLDSTERAGANVNWTHANAIALRPDGLLLASFRNLSEVTAINTFTGAIEWRLGGRHDEFGLAACCAPVFARQHGLRVTATGSLMFLDNLGTPGDSRVERYTVTPATHHAQKDAAFSATPAVIAMLGGSVQELANGNVLAAFGDGHRVEELDPTGRVVWRINGDPGYVFRAERIASLYAPGVIAAR